MPRLSVEARNRVISLHSCGLRVPAIYERFQAEDVDISQRAIYYLVEKYRTKGMYHV